MSSISREHPVVSFILEIGLWLSMSGSFLWLYVEHFAAPTASVIPHLWLLTYVFVTSVCIRVMVWRALGRSLSARWLAAAILSSTLFIVGAYYTAVLIGLNSWGRVISWKLIATYVSQLPDLIRILGASPWVVYGALLVTFLVLTMAVFAWPRSLLWSARAAFRMSSAATITTAILVQAIIGIRLYSFFADNLAALGEPVSLTFFPVQAGGKLQTHSTKSAALDIAETATRSTYRRSETANKRNVIFIVGDALRPDHMHAYGYSRETTPYIDDLINRPGTERMERMFAVCAESACGLTAMSRSKYVHQLSSESFSLFDVLRTNGYRIHMILGGDHTNFYGLREGYGPVDSYFDGSSKNGYYMNDDQLVLDHTASLPTWDGVPVYLQFHLMSTHPLGARHDSSMRYLPASNYAAWARSTSSISASESEGNSALNFYDNGVLQFDATVHAILQTLEQKGYLSNTLVVITADHGELLGEHAEFGHAKSVYQEALHLPFVMLRYGYSAPPFAEQRIASQVDIAPTITSELGVAAPATWFGHALQQSFPNRLTFFQQDSSVGLFDFDSEGRWWKYWKNTRTGEEFVFALDTDPGELNNVSASTNVDILAEWRHAVLPAVNMSTSE